MSTTRPPDLHDALSEIHLIIECVYMATEALGSSDEAHALQSVLNVAALKISNLMELVSAGTKEAVVLKTED